MKTPLIRSNKLSTKYNANIFLKLEYLNPTGSHKDRETEMLIRDAISKGKTSIGCASTGNAAISLAFHSWRSGLECHIWLSNNVPPYKLEFIKSFPVTIHFSEKEYAQIIDESNYFFNENGIYNANPGTNKLRILADEEIGKEISSTISPDWIISPVNNGSNLIGIWNGCQASGKYPRMVAVTTTKNQLASSINGFSRLEGEKEIDEIIKQSKGHLVKVTELDTLRSAKEAFENNLTIEPSTAAVLSALKNLNCQKSENVVLILTGTCLKYPSLIKKITSQNHSSE